MNEFSNYYTEATKGFNKGQKYCLKCSLAYRLKKSVTVINNWINGITTPNYLEKKAINVCLRRKVYENID